jgi:hypothetical protein
MVRQYESAASNPKPYIFHSLGFVARRSCIQDNAGLEHIRPQNRSLAYGGRRNTALASQNSDLRTFNILVRELAATTVEQPSSKEPK